MRRSTRGVLVALASTLVLAVGGSAALAAPGAYDRPGRTAMTSVASDGTQGDVRAGAELFCGGYSKPRTSDISASGRYVAFISPAHNLVAGDTNAMCDVFRHDRKTGKTVRVSVGSNGSQGLGSSGEWGLSISATGRYVAFDSEAPNLVPGDTNLRKDISVRDLKNASTTRVSVSTRGDQAESRDGNGSLIPSISADGRYVLFLSYADNLVAKDTNSRADAFVHDLETGNTTLASVSSKGAQGNGHSHSGTISSTGRYVAFTSEASNLVPGDTTAELCKCDATNVFVRDMKAKKTRRVSVASDGSQASFSAFPSCTVGAVPPTGVGGLEIFSGSSGISICGSDAHSVSGRVISSDGRYVTFTSDATNLVPNDTNFGTNNLFGHDIFVHDLKTRRTERVSVDSYGHERREDVWMGASVISGTGRYVAYGAQTNRVCGPGGVIPPPPDPLIPGGCTWLSVLDPELEVDLLYRGDSYVYDRAAGSMESLSAAAKKPGSCTSAQRALGLEPMDTWVGALNGDGRYAALWSSAQDLVRGDRNRLCDTFAYDRGPQVGVGGFGGVGSGSDPGSSEVCVAAGVCLPQLSTVDSVGDVRAPLAAQGADLIGSRVVPRQGLGDVFVRLDLARMPQMASVPAGGPLYGLAFTLGGQRYEVRVQRVPSADYDAKGGASFGLFRQDPVAGVFTKVAALKGGYGTTGASVVVAVPLKELGVENGGRLSDVRAFSGVGSYLSGATKVLDTVWLGR